MKTLDDMSNFYTKAKNNNKPHSEIKKMLSEIYLKKIN